MAKVLVNLTVPAISESYDVLIPDFMRVRALINVLTELVTDLSSGQYVASGKECLCSREYSRTLELHTTIRECGIKNGDHLYLF